MHRFILLSFLNPLWSPHVSLKLTYAPPGHHSQPFLLLFFPFTLFEACKRFSPSCVCAGLKSRHAGQEGSSGREVGRRAHAGAEMFVLRACSSRGGKLSNEQVGALTRRSLLAVQFIRPADICGFISTVMKNVSATWPFSPFVCRVLPTAAVVAPANTWWGCKALNYTWFN